jgi:RNA polymerase sigma factor (sigma-70 family)
VLRRQSDERLVALARAGHVRAVEVIVARYHAPLLRYCRRLLGPARAEDAVQQTFLNAYRGICDGDFELELRAWLYRIAQNVAHDLLRRNGAFTEPIDEAPGTSASAADEQAKRERFTALVAAMRRLPSRQRRAIVGRELEGRSHADIASELGVTDGAVRQLIHRARNTLRGAASAVIPSAIARWLPAPPPVKIGATLAATGALVAGGIAPPFTPDAPTPRRGSTRALVNRGESRPARAQVGSTAVSRSAPSPSQTTGAVTQTRGFDPGRDRRQPSGGGDAAQGARGSGSGADVGQAGEHRGENSSASGTRPPPPAVAVTASEGGQQQGHSDGAGSDQSVG